MEMTSGIFKYASQSSAKVLTVALMLYAAPLFATGPTGSTSVVINEAHWYEFVDDIEIGAPNWYPTNGQVIDSQQTGSTFRALVLWNATGSGSIQFRNGETVLGTLNVSVGELTDPPQAPAVGNAQSVGATFFTATWEHTSGAFGYRLDVANNSGFSPILSGYNNLYTTSNSQLVTGLEGGTSYYYRIRAENTYGASSNSGTGSLITLPLPPGTASPSGFTTTSFVANWAASTSATSYRLDVSLASNFSSFVSGYNNLTVSNIYQTVSGLSPGTVYYYRVRAVRDSYTTASSTTMSALTLPLPPATLSRYSMNHSTFTATWTASQSATSYELDVSTNSSFSSYVSGYDSVSVSGLSKLVTGLSGGTTYYYRLRALNASGSSSNSSTGTALTLSDAPVATAATSVGQKQFTANWNSVASAYEYRIDVWEASSSNANPLQNYNYLLVPTGTYKIVYDLYPDVTYVFRVRAVNTSGDSAPSNEITVVTLPHTPIVAAATNVTATSFVANWYGSGNYLLDVSWTSDFATGTFVHQDLAVTGTSKVVSGLSSANLSYYYRLRKTNASGNSPYSQVIATRQLEWNYVKTSDILVSGITTPELVASATIDEKRVATAFYDGIGRPSQEISLKQSPSELDIIQPHVYDASGMEQTKYLPYVAGSTGWYRADFIPKDNALYTDAESPQYQFYHDSGFGISGDDVPYSDETFEESPLKRPLTMRGAGAAWLSNDKKVVLSYPLNEHGTYTGSEKVISWSIDGYGMPVRASAVTDYIVTGGYYASGQLNIRSTVDEEGNETREYTDKSGRIVLKKVQAQASAAINTHTHWAQTYYVFDIDGNLRYVLPPELSKLVHQNDSYNPTSTDLNSWAFQYHYDARNRMTEKRVPGADWVYMVYDSRDRLVLTQDGNQRATATKYWTFTKYDQLNRPILTGIRDTTAALSQADMQAVVAEHEVDAGAALFETYVGSASDHVHGYSNKSYPVITGAASEVDLNKYLSVTYYDNYAFTSLWYGSYTYIDDNLSETANSITYHQPDAANTHVTGQVTGSKVKVLDGGMTGGVTWLKSVSYYDDRYRVIQTQGSNYKGGVDIVSNVYDFTGKVLKTKTTHSEADVIWKDMVNVAWTGAKLSRTVSGNSWGDSGAASVQQLAASTNGWVEFTVGELYTRAVGLSDTNPDADYVNMDYCLRQTTGAINLFMRTAPSST